MVLHTALAYTGPWYQLADIAAPVPGAKEESQEVMVTSLHWTTSAGEKSQELLLVTYLNHGIRFVAPSLA